MSVDTANGFFFKIGFMECGGGSKTIFSHQSMPRLLCVLQYICILDEHNAKNIFLLTLTRAFTQFNKSLSPCE